MEQNLIQIAHKHSAYANEIDILYNPTLTKEDATRIKNQYLTDIDHVYNVSIYDMSQKTIYKEWCNKVLIYRKLLSWFVYDIEKLQQRGYLIVITKPYRI